MSRRKNRHKNRSELSISKCWDKFEGALRYFTSAIEQAEAGDLNELENSGLVSAFTSTQGAACRFLHQYLKDKHIKLKGKDLYDMCYELELIDSPELWREIHDARNLAAHEYDSEQIEDIRAKVIDEFYPAFEQFKNRFGKLYEQDNE